MVNVRVYFDAEKSFPKEIFGYSNQSIRFFPHPIFGMFRQNGVTNYGNCYQDVPLSFLLTGEKQKRDWLKKEHVGASIVFYVPKEQKDHFIKTDDNVTFSANDCERMIQGKNFIRVISFYLKVTGKKIEQLPKKSVGYQKQIPHGGNLITAGKVAIDTYKVLKISLSKWFLPVRQLIANLKRQINILVAYAKKKIK